MALNWFFQIIIGNTILMTCHEYLGALTLQRNGNELFMGNVEEPSKYRLIKEPIRSKNPRT